MGERTGPLDRGNKPPPGLGLELWVSGQCRGKEDGPGLLGTCLSPDESQDDGVTARRKEVASLPCFPATETETRWSLPTAFWELGHF